MHLWHAQMYYVGKEVENAKILNDVANGTLDILKENERTFLCGCRKY